MIDKVEFSPTDNIIDICTGSHFTLFVTDSGKLFGSGSSLFKEIDFTPDVVGKFVRLPIIKEDLLVKRVWCSKAKDTYLAVIEV